MIDSYKKEGQMVDKRIRDLLHLHNRQCEVSTVQYKHNVTNISTNDKMF